METTQILDYQVNGIDSMQVVIGSSSNVRGGVKQILGDALRQCKFWVQVKVSWNNLMKIISKEVIQKCCIHVTGFSSISYYSSPNLSQKCNSNIDLSSTFLDLYDITNKCSSFSFVPSQLAQNKYVGIQLMGEI